MYVFLCASLYGLFSTYLDVPLSLSALNAALLSFVSVFRLWYGLPFNYLHRSFVSLYFGLSVRPFLFLSLSLFIDWSFQFVAGSSSPTAATFSPVKLVWEEKRRRKLFLNIFWRWHKLLCPRLPKNYLTLVMKSRAKKKNDKSVIRGPLL